MGESRTRREFLKTAGRLLAAGGLGFLGLRLVGAGRKSLREICVGEGVCKGCTTFTGCGLPAALSARQSAPWARGDGA
jgi:hypothetical protein